MILTTFLLCFFTNSWGIVQKINYGTSFDGLDLVAFKIFNPEKSGVFSGRAVFLSAGAHGNEVSGHLKYFLSQIKSVDSTNLIDNGLTIYIVPSLNPDGVSSKRRLSHPGFDLNRQFQTGGYQLQEAFYLKQFIDSEIVSKEIKVELAIDYHCCSSSLIKPAGVQPSHKNFQKYAEILSLGQKLLSRTLEMGNTIDFFSKSNTGTLKDFWHKNHNAVSLTFEAGTIDPNKKILKDHVLWLYSVIRSTLN